MNKFAKIAVLAFALFLVFSPAVVLAQDAAAPDAVAPAAASKALAYAAAGFGAGLVIIGGAYGISKIGGSAVESMARQPELAGGIQTAMIIAAALIEGVTFFALIICLLCLIL